MNTDELIQTQRNSEELRKFVSELADWEKEARLKDEEIKRNRLLSESKENKAAKSASDFNEALETTLDLSYKHEKNLKENKPLDIADIRKALDCSIWGSKYLIKERYQDAVECFTKGTLHDPKNAVLLANRAMAYLKIGMFESAEEDCTNALHIKPTYVKALLRRGVARVVLEKYDCARKDFLKVLELEPKNEQALMELEKLEKKENKAAESVTDFNEALKTTLDLSYKHEKNLMENKPLEIADMGNSLDFWLMGNQYFREELYQEAVECYTKGVLDDPKNPILLANRAMAYLKIGKHMFESAEEDCTKVLHIKPTYVKAFLRRGAARVALEDYDCARKDFLKALELEPKNKHALMALEKLEKMLLAGDKCKVSSVLNQHSEKKDSHSSAPSNSGEKKDLFEKSLIHVPPVLPVVPETSYQFYIDWRRLKAFPDLQYAYLKQFVADKFPVLFQKSMEPDLFSGILGILHTFFIRNGDKVSTYLKFLSQIGRFQTLLMMLSPLEIKGVNELMNYMRSSEQHLNQADYIAKLYNIT